MKPSTSFSLVLIAFTAASTTTFLTGFLSDGSIELVAPLNLAFIALAIITVTFQRPAESEYTALGGLKLPLTMFSAAILARTAMLWQFGTAAEKGALLLLIAFTLFFVHGENLSSIGFISRNWKGAAVSGLGLGGIFGALFLGSSYVMAEIFGGGTRLYLFPQSTDLAVWFILFTIGTAISEEALFRGYIQKSLSFLGNDEAITAQAILFGIWHIPLILISGQQDPAILLVLALQRMMISGIWGIAAGLLFDSLRNLTSTILMHFTWNTILAFIVFLPSNQTPYQGAALTLSYGIIGLILILVLKRRFRMATSE